MMHLVLNAKLLLPHCVLVPFLICFGLYLWEFAGEVDRSETVLLCFAFI